MQAFLKHKHVLALYDKLVVELGQDERFISGVYILMELAVGGDLFDKICAWFSLLSPLSHQTEIILLSGPDVGVEEDTAHMYFEQLVSGVVRFLRGMTCWY